MAAKSIALAWKNMTIGMEVRDPSDIGQQQRPMALLGLNKAITYYLSHVRIVFLFLASGSELT